MKKNKNLITIFVLLFSLLFASLLSSCTSKEERCNQVAVAMLKYDFIGTNQYHTQSVQNMCKTYWDYPGNDTWRDCILDASSRDQMNRCGMPTTTKPYQNQH